MRREKMIRKGIRVVSTASTFAQYDAYAKKILSHKIFLSHILKGTIPEFKDMDPTDIVPLIEGEICVSEVPVEAGLTNQVMKSSGNMITGNNTESTVPTEGTIYYDIIFYVRTKNGRSQIIVNIEAQKKEDNIAYDLFNRGAYYVCRMVSSQKERDFIKSNYNDMVSVYSIWICFNMDQNCMNYFKLKDHTLVGNYRWPGKDDLLNLILVGLDKKFSTVLEEQTGRESDLHHMLRIIFSDRLNGKEKAKLLEETLQISVDEEVREELNDMTGLLYGIVEKTKKETMEEAKKEAEKERREIIQNMLKESFTKEQIKKVLKATDTEIARVEKEMLVK